MECSRGWLISRIMFVSFTKHIMVNVTYTESFQDFNAHHVLADSSSLDFIKSESSSKPLLDVVLEGRASDDGPQGLQGPGSNAGSLGGTGLAPAFLAGRLVEPGLDVTIPILVEVLVRHHLVAFGRHD